jgi:cobyrinic acid a,c-diamide synthase
MNPGMAAASNDAPRCKAFVIAGTHSGCGKTLVSLAIMAALRARGMSVAPFKVGPDFIDPTLHAAVCGRASHNLDPWMCGPEACRGILLRHARGCAVAVVEGVMGLFDGVSGASDEGSTAALARLLGLPVALVLDARSMARSVAALALGYTAYDPALPIAGLILNRVGSPNHADLLREALETSPNLPSSARALGLLPRDEALALPSRHLGLVIAQDSPLDADLISRLARWAEDNLDLTRLLGACPALEFPPEEPASAPAAPANRVRIGIAQDAAFCFTYAENLRLLEAAGAELVPFSPLADKALPLDLAGLYLPGGYPELHAAALAANAGLRAEIKKFSVAGRPVYAECGGFMYLMESIKDPDGRTLPMCGVFALSAAMLQRFAALGYREAVTTRDSFFGPAWTMLRGHEFHYSSPTSADPDAQPLYKVRDRRGWTDQAEGFVKRNTLGSYIHLHLASNPDAAAAFVEACRAKTAID